MPTPSTLIPQDLFIVAFPYHAVLQGWVGGRGLHLATGRRITVHGENILFHGTFTQIVGFQQTQLVIEIEGFPLGVEQSMKIWVAIPYVHVTIGWQEQLRRYFYTASSQLHIDSLSLELPSKPKSFP